MREAALGDAILLNSQTGLIGMPSQTIEGIFARCLINPSIGIHSQVQINQGDIIGAQPAITNAGEDHLASLPIIAADGLYIVVARMAEFRQAEHDAARYCGMDLTATTRRKFTAAIPRVSMPSR